MTQTKRKTRKTKTTRARKGSDAASHAQQPDDNSVEREGQWMRLLADLDLTERRRRFVFNYAAMGNGSKAAKDAGFAVRQEAARLLIDPIIQEAIRRVRAHIAMEAELTAGDLVRQWRRIAFTDMRDVAKWGPDGVVVRDSQHLSDHQHAAVSEVAELRDDEGNLKRVFVKLKDKHAALDALAKVLGAYKPQQHEFNVDPSIFVLPEGMDV